MRLKVSKYICVARFLLLTVLASLRVFLIKFIIVIDNIRRVR